MNDQYIDIVFQQNDHGDGVPVYEFVEVENEDGASIKTGEWLSPSLIGGDFWRLRMKVKPGLSGLAAKIHDNADAHGFWPKDREESIASLGYLRGRLSEHMDEADATHWQQVLDYVTAQPVRNVGEMLMLAVSELAEALEQHRDGKPSMYWCCKRCGRMAEIESGHLDTDTATIRHSVSGHHYTPNGSMFGRGMDCHGEFKPEGILIEIADCIIRCLDTSIPFGPIEFAVMVKMAYNTGRSHMHGKAY